LLHTLLFYSWNDLLSKLFVGADFELLCGDADVTLVNPHAGRLLWLGMQKFVFLEKLFDEYFL
jgi:hypothetical protein